MAEPPEEVEAEGPAEEVLEMAAASRRGFAAAAVARFGTPEEDRQPERLEAETAGEGPMCSVGNSAFCLEEVLDVGVEAVDEGEGADGDPRCNRNSYSRPFFTQTGFIQMIRPFGLNIFGFYGFTTLKFTLEAVFLERK